MGLFFSQRKGRGVQGSLHVNITEVPGPLKRLEGARGVPCRQSNPEVMFEGKEHILLKQSKSYPGRWGV